MRLNVVFNVLSLVLLFVGGMQLAPLAVSAWLGQDDFYPFLFSCALAFGTGGLVWYLTRHFTSIPRNVELRHREGFAIVGLGWILLSLFGALPFIFDGTFANPAAGAIKGTARAVTDSVFEAVSGFTTTGASVLTDYDQPRGIMFWRSMTHWIGGMGIILFSIAILPLLGAGGMQLYKAEVPGPVKDRLTPRITDTAKILWTVYLMLSVIQTSLLRWLGKMSWFDAVCHTFGTMATGGFSTYSSSLIETTPTVQYIVIAFMTLAGISFALHYRALMPRGFPANLLLYLRDRECLFYLRVLAIAALVVVVGEWLDGARLGEELLRHALFQVVSIATTTGFITADYEAWHPVAQVTLFFLMFCGGCAGSTGGGVKMIRVLLAIKICVRELVRMAHPRSVLLVRLHGMPLPEVALAGVGAYLLMFSLTFIVSSVLLAIGGHDPLTAMSASVAALGNIGPGLGTVGPSDSFAHFATWQKWLLCVTMLLGRLEFYAILILFIPSFWKR